ncbi:hypothetical protein ACF8C4_05400 [Myroides odoratimimus]|uniref:hypothetical protein n=1 Tax=Myroides odoratimimus TaxID=76832 RepID=UPI00370B2706
MKNSSEILRELNSLEEKYDLGKYYIGEVPLWRLVRFKVRIERLSKETGFTNKSKITSIRKLEVIKFFFISFFQLIKQFFFIRKKRKHVFFAFPRLFNIDGIYIDKFTDPIINLGIKDSNEYIIFQHSLANKHHQPRFNRQSLIYSDFIDVVSVLFGSFFSLLYSFKYRKVLHKFVDDVKKVYPDTALNNRSVAKELAVIKVYIFCYQKLLNMLSPTNVFIVGREVFKFISILKKSQGFKLYEIQHGITQSNTPMYTGKYLENYDPDLFLVFGYAWVNLFYGVPVDKIRNIGFAYHNFIRSKKESLKKVFHYNEVLIISSPSITKEILLFLESVFNMRVDLSFHLRLHPQEALTDDQRHFLLSNNVKILSNEEDAIFCVNRYHNVIGDNSSVLYEALAMGKKVGKLNFLNMYSRDLVNDIANGFFIIKDYNDLINMVNELSVQCNNKYYYTDFNELDFNKII